MMFLQNKKKHIYIYIYIYIYISFGGACGVTVIVVGNGHGDTRVQTLDKADSFHIALIPLGYVWMQLSSPPAMGK